LKRLAELAGRWLEPRGNSRPRGMTVGGASPAQNPAYRLTSKVISRRAAARSKTSLSRARRERSEEERAGFEMLYLFTHRDNLAGEFVIEDAHREMRANPNRRSNTHEP